MKMVDGNLDEHIRTIKELNMRYCQLISAYAEQLRKHIEKDKRIEDLKQQISYMRSTLNLIEDSTDRVESIKKEKDIATDGLG